MELTCFVNSGTQHTKIDEIHVSITTNGNCSYILYMNLINLMLNRGIIIASNTKECTVLSEAIHCVSIPVFILVWVIKRAVV